MAGDVNKKRRVVLKTERLLLVEARLSDAPFYFELMNTPGWLKYIGDRGIQSIADAEKYLAIRVIKGYLDQGFGFYIMITKRGQHKVGVSGIIKRPELDHVDIGFALLPQYERRGYAIEATRAVMDYATNNLGIYPICAITTYDNYASQKLLEKIGLRKYGIHMWDDKEELLLYSNAKEDEPDI